MFCCCVLFVVVCLFCFNPGHRKVMDEAIMSTIRKYTYFHLVRLVSYISLRNKEKKTLYAENSSCFRLFHSTEFTGIHSSYVL